MSQPDSTLVYANAVRAALVGLLDLLPVGHHLAGRIGPHIAEDMGMIGMDWGVNFCVIGLDRNWSYEPHCRAAKP